VALPQVVAEARAGRFTKLTPDMLVKNIAGNRVLRK